LDLIALATLVAIILRRHRQGAVIYAAAYALLVAWTASISASYDKSWAADVAHGITGVVDGDRLAVHNFPNFSWRTRS
jgi:hypothetical protein